MKRTLLTVSLGLVLLLLLPALVAQQKVPKVLEHFGMCDASAAVAVGPTMFIVADDEDEDNKLRVYRRDKPGKPVQTFNLTTFLKPDPEHPEADIEGAARVGERVYWITSHGANKNGKLRPSRHRLFATTVEVSGDAVTVTPVGKPYKDLVEELAKAPSLQDGKLGELLRNGAKQPPEAAGGLNIEGLCAMPGGPLLIGFRNPIVGNKALLIPLENPAAVIEGKAAKFGKPIRLALGGRGVRSIEYFEAKNKYLIVAGPPGDGGDFQLYQWSGVATDEPALVKGVNFSGLQPEALLMYPGETTRIQVLSDDGTKQVDGMDCKDAKPAKRSFRSTWVTP